MNYLPLLLSGSDPTGVLFSNGERYLRGITKNEVEKVKEMQKSGFFDELISKRLIPKTKILTENIPNELKEYNLVLEHEGISPILYPREWSFEMTRAAVLSFLEIGNIAFSHGYYCKDCHLFNFVFDGTRPLWVDIGSFVKTNKKVFPFPLKSFYLSILIPLKIWSNGAEFIGSHLLSSPIAFPNVEILLYKYPITRWSIKLQTMALFFINVKFFLITKSHYFTRIILKSLRKKLVKMNNIKKSQWVDYHNEYIDKRGNPVEDERFNRIVQLLGEYTPASILELAGNAGILSEIILKRMKNIKIICTDYDSLAIDSLFRRLRHNKILNLFCAKFDFMVTENSSVEIASESRMKSDCVLALAVTHHLLLTQGYSYNNIFERIRLYSKQYVFIEYMPLGLWNGKVAPPLPSWYSQVEFTKAFCQYFEILKIEKLDENRILFIGKVKI